MVKIKNKFYYSLFTVCLLLLAVKSNFANIDTKKLSFSIQNTGAYSYGLNSSYFTYWCNSSISYNESWFTSKLTAQHQRNFQLGQYISAMIPLRGIEYDYINVSSVELQQTFIFFKKLKFKFSPSFFYGESNYRAYNLAFDASIEFKQLEFEVSYTQKKASYNHRDLNVYYKQQSITVNISFFLNNYISIDSSTTHQRIYNHILEDDYLKTSSTLGTSILLFQKHYIFIGAQYSSDNLEYRSYGAELALGFLASKNINIALQGSFTRNFYYGPETTTIRDRDRIITVPMPFDSFNSYSLFLSFEIKI